MQYELFKKLHEDGLVGKESFEKISREEQHPLVSVYWDLNTLLGLGVILFSTGLGILVYKNIDTIGHQVILALSAAISIACFSYCGRKNPAFSKYKITTSRPIVDYILLLGTLTMLTFTAYLQYQYQVFGTHYGLATFIPMVFLFFIAYYFDHTGILNMAILNVGVWMGVSVTPRQLLMSSNYNSETIIYTYLLLGFILLILAFLSDYYKFKAHFKFSYQNFGVHVSFIALLSAYISNYNFGSSFLWLIGIIVLAFLLYKDAIQHKSFYFSLLSILYSYIALSCIIVRLFDQVNQAIFELLFLYFAASAIGFVYLLKKVNQKIKAI
jgi:hypothetical protein